MKVHVTQRDKELLGMLTKARWLTTRQIHRYFFRNGSPARNGFENSPSEGFWVGAARRGPSSSSGG